MRQAREFSQDKAWAAVVLTAEELIAVAGDGPGRAEARLAELVKLPWCGTIDGSVITHEYLDPIPKPARRDCVATVTRSGLVQVKRVNRTTAANVNERRRREGNVRGELLLLRRGVVD